MIAAVESESLVAHVAVVDLNVSVAHPLQSLAVLAVAVKLKLGKTSHPRTVVVRVVEGKRKIQQKSPKITTNVIRKDSAVAVSLVRAIA